MIDLDHDKWVGRFAKHLIIVDPKLFCKGFEGAFGLYVYNLVIASENMQDMSFILFFTL